MNKSIKIIANYILGPLLFVILSYVIYQQIIQQPDLKTRWHQIRTSWKDFLFWFSLLLMTINWGIEAKKWQLLISLIEKHSFLQSCKGVLTGCSMTMLTPNRIGEFGGRVMFVDPANRPKALSLTILGSISQLTVTFIMGLVGIFFFRVNNSSFEVPVTFHWIISNLILFVTLVGSVFLLLLLFNFHSLFVLFSRFHFLKKIVNSLSIVELYTRKQLLRIFFLSFFRYLTFILQYIFLLKVMQVNIPFEKCFWLLSLFYLLMALAPTIGFIELPVRASLGLLLLGGFSNNIIGIQAATFTIWAINIILPAIIGSILIFRLKFLK